MSIRETVRPNREMFRLIFSPHETWPVYARDKRQTSVAGGFRYSLFAVTVVIEGLRKCEFKGPGPVVRCLFGAGPVRKADSSHGSEIAPRGGRSGSPVGALMNRSTHFYRANQTCWHVRTKYGELGPLVRIHIDPKAD